MRPRLRPYLAMLAAVARWRLAAAVGLMVACSLTEGAGIALLLPVLQAAGLDLNGQGAAGRYAKLIARGVASVGLQPTLLVLLGIVIALISARSALHAAQSVASFAVNQTIVFELRRRLYDAIANASWLFVARQRSSDFTHALTAELERVANATWRLMTLAADAILVLLLLGVAFALSPPMTALVMGCGAILAFLLRGRTRAIHETGGEISQATSRVYAAATEHLQSLKTVKTYGAQQRSSRIFAALSEELRRLAIVAVRQQALSAALFEIGSVLALGATIYLAVRVAAVPPAAVLILLLVFSRVMPKLLSVHVSYQAFASSLPGFTNVAALEARCRAEAEPPEAPGPPLKLRAAMRLEAVSFSYGAQGEPALREIDLLIPAGAITAIVGPSGAGKSTIADLVMGLIAPSQGRVTIDGGALDPALARRWREQIGYVGQETFLFHDSVRANLLWARPEASEADMRSALELAAAGELVRRLPAGLESIVGDRGALLSHGERQRLALARAMLRRPSMLVLDEATSSLDPENENRVLAAIRDLRGRLTILLIAHRLSTIRWADLIYVVENGRVVESGDWDTLNARRDGRFRALCEAQSIGA